MNWPWSEIQLRHVGKVRCEPGWSLSPDWSAALHDCDLWYVWAGSGSMQINGQSHDLTPGTCIWMRPGRTYLAQHDPRDPLGVSFIHFVPVDKSGRVCLGHEDLPPEVYQVTDPLFFSAVMTRIVDLLRGFNTHRGGEHHGGPASDSIPLPARWLFQSLLYELIAAGPELNNRRASTHRLTIEKQVAQIYEQPGRTPAVRTLAANAGLSADHYSRLFRDLTGTSPRELIQQARIERACQLLRETPLSISEIADQAGYADVFQFSRLFRRRLGVSPSRWRRA